MGWSAGRARWPRLHNLLEFGKAKLDLLAQLLVFLRTGFIEYPNEKGTSCDQNWHSVFRSITWFSRSQYYLVFQIA
eukprot:SAG25_NODE_10379_length_336_cov_1.873418_1_plen_75_part_01